jgi:threonine/homoserine/homoserine lactone efflux protein
MPLSEHEQRLLDQIERALYAEDPKFASTVRGARLRRPSRRRRLQGIALFVLGVALLVLGVVLPLKPGGIPVVSLLGFLVMFFGALLTLTAIRHGDQGDESADESAGPGNVTKIRRSSFSQRMEERFRKRFDDDQ